MKNLKLVVVAAALSMSTAAMAQEDAVSNTMQVATPAAQTKEQANKDRADYAERATKQTAHVSEICGLNDDQKVKVFQIYLNSYAEMKKVKDAAGKDADKAKEAVNKIQKARIENIESVLTPDQNFRLQNEEKMNKVNPIDVEPSK